MRSVVTGGAGFIGSALVRHLVHEAGDSVLTIDALTYAGTRASLRLVEGSASHQFIHADVRDGAALDAALAQFQPDRIIHCAAETHVDRSIIGAGVFIDTNIVGSYTLFEAARRYWDGLAGAAQARFRVLHVSTDEVHGSLGPEGRFSETSGYDPSSPYAASKAAADHLARAWHRTYGLPVVIAQCSNNYGPYQFPEKLIPLTILNALHGRPIPVYGSGAQVRDWLFVEDHARALDLISAQGQPGETYAIGGGNERRNLAVVEAICDTLDRLKPAARPRRELIAFVADRPGHDARYAIDATRLQRDLGWQAATMFDQGLTQTVQWYLDNRWWWQPLLDRAAGA